METDEKTPLDGTIPHDSGDAKETAMGKVLRCRDLGMKCTHEIRAETEEELLQLAAEHAEKDHGIHAASIPPSIMAMVKAAIRDE
jgi:predicted small metal-binding protein